MGKPYECRLDRLGRIVVPAEIRRALGLGPGAELGFSLQDFQLILDPVAARCAFLHSSDPADELTMVNGRLVCRECRQGLIDLRDR